MAAIKVSVSVKDIESRWCVRACACVCVRECACGVCARGWYVCVCVCVVRHLSVF